MLHGTPLNCWKVWGYAEAIFFGKIGLPLKGLNSRLRGNGLLAMLMSVIK